MNLVFLQKGLLLLLNHRLSVIVSRLIRPSVLSKTNNISKSFLLLDNFSTEDNSSTCLIFDSSICLCLETQTNRSSGLSNNLYFSSPCQAPCRPYKEINTLLIETSENRKLLPLLLEISLIILYEDTSIPTPLSLFSIFFHYFHLSNI